VLQCTLIGMLYLLCCGIASSVSDLLYATERMAESAGITFVQGIVLTAASVAAAGLGWGPVGMAWAYMLGPLTAALLATSLVQRKFFPVRFRWSRTRFVALLRESRALTAQLTVETLNVNVESVLVPKLLGATVFGYYSAGLLPASRLTVVSDGLSTAFYPIIARKWLADRREAAWEAVRFWMLSTGASTVIALGSMLLAPLAAAILFPKDPETSRLVISVTVWSLPLIASAEAMAYSLNASGHHGLQARLTICATPISLAVTGILIWKLGLMGACYIWVTRPLVTLCFYVPAYIRVFGPHLKARRLRRVELPVTGPAEAVGSQ
jgi:O-antigen/teichoic acid export membrane protein